MQRRQIFRAIKNLRLGDGGNSIGENRLNDSDKSRVKHYVRCLQE